MYKNPYFILTILIVLLLGIKAFSYYKSNQNPDSQIYQHAIGSLDAKTITSFKITSPTLNLEFVKSGTDWLVNNQKADSSKITTLIAGLVNFNQVELASENPKNLLDYGISSTSAKLILPNQAFIVGKPTDNQHYLELDGKKAVFLVSGLPQELTELKLSDWLDKSVVASPSPAASSLKTKSK